MCTENDYRDEVSGRCLHLCGVNNTMRCLIDEECHHSSGTCRNKCHGRCDHSSLYCDPTSTHCEACEDVCDPISIIEYPDCKIHCPKQFMLLKEGHAPGVKLTTARPSSTPVLSALPSLATATLASANGKSDQYIIISVICLFIIALMVVVIYAWRRWSNNRGGKRNTQKVSRHQEDVEQMLPEIGPASASTSNQTTANYPQSGSCDTISTSHIPETEKNQLLQDNVLESSNHRLNNEGLITDHRSYDSDPMCHETIPEPASGALNQSVHTVSEQGSHSIDNGCILLYTSHSSLASFPSYKSVSSFSLGPDETISFSGFVATQTLESPKDTHVDAKTFYDEQIRQIKSFDWGSVGNLDLREDGQIPPEETSGVVFQTPTPSLQARIDEKIAIMEILDKMEFVEFHLFSRDKVTVVIKNNSISLVEARKQLLDAGVPDRMFTVEYLK